MEEEEAKEGDENIEGADAEGMGEEETKAEPGLEAETPSSPGKSPKKKKGSLSKGKSKKSKKEDPNKLELLEYKKSDKTKKFIVAEKVKNPEIIMEFIKEKYPKDEEPLDKDQPPKHGVNAMSLSEIQELVHQLYYKVEKNKLKHNTMKKKFKYTDAQLQKMLLHMALNFDIKVINEDLGPEMASE